jgi:hypothetical protein
MFKILSTYICWKKYIKCNISRVPLRPSYIEDAGFLKVNVELGNKHPPPKKPFFYFPTALI